ncbi:MAG: tetratricopeptide repeat protein [Mariprofundales bacterium]
MRIIIAIFTLTLLAACQPHPITHSQHKQAVTEKNAKHIVPLNQLEPDFLFIAAQSAIDKGQMATAAAYLKVVVNKDPYAALPRAQLAEALLKSKQARAALPHFAILLDNKSIINNQLDEKERLRLQLLQAAAHISIHHVDAAIKILKKVLRQHPKQLAAQLQLAKLYLTQNHAKQALAVITQGIAQHDSPQLRQAQAQILLKQGRAKAALKSLQTMQKLAPNNAFIAILFSQFALQMGRADLAEQRLRDFLQHHPDNLNVTRTLGGFLVQNGRSGEATLLYSQLLKRNPTMHEARTTLGLLYLQTKQYKSAEKTFANQNDDGNKFYYAASIEAQQHRDQEALALYHAFPSTSPMHAQALLRIASIAIRHDDDRKALTMVRQLLTDKKLHHPQLSEAWVLLSSILLYQDHYQQVIDETAPALKAAPIAPRLLFNRAVAFEHFHRYHDAETMLQAQFKQQPNDPEALNFLGYMLAEQGIRLDESEQLIRRALKIAPNNGYYLDSLAWVHYQRDDFAAAIQLQQKAIQQVPDDATIFEHLGDMQWKDGDHNAAQQSWIKALTLKHPHPNLIKLKIKQGLQ